MTQWKGNLPVLIPVRRPPADSFSRGMRYGLALSVPLWLLIAAVAWGAYELLRGPA